MKYFVEVDGTEHLVHLRERQGALTVEVDGEPLALTYAEVDRNGQAHLRVGDRSFAISVEGDGEQIGVTLAGHYYSVAVEDERERAAHAAQRSAGARGGPIKSVMPGVVVRLLVAEGDVVEAGQPLLLLEAMKMQNEILATSAGSVAAVHVAEGRPVGAGEKLVTIRVSAD